MRLRGPLPAFLLSSALLWVSAPLPASETALARASATAAYGRADFGEARRLFEQLDAQGELTPSELYRLYFAESATGAGAEATATLARATTALEQAWQLEPTLEVGFYLANAYIASNRTEDGRRIARDATARVAAGELPVRTGVDKFQAGKLHVDLGDDAAAATLLRAALTELESRPSPENDGYVAWASHWLAERAVAARDWSAAEIHLTSYNEHIQPKAADWDRLAVTRARNEMYLEAAAAWNAAVPLDPVNADRARYAARLAEAAARRGGLPARPAAGEKPFAEMSRPDLERFLIEGAARARATRGEAAAAGEPLPPDATLEFRSRLDLVRGEFVAAALEYTLRGHSLRETAFMGGYAPLVFRESEWKLPGLPDDRAAPTGVKRERAAQALKEAQEAQRAQDPQR